LALTLLGFITLSAGYGTPLVMCLVSAPTAWLGLPAALILTPALWSTLFAWSEHLENKARRRRFAIAMTIHYVTAAVLVTFARISMGAIVRIAQTPIGRFP